MPCAERGALNRLDVRGVGALRAGLGVVADLRALRQRLEAAAGNAAVVHEQVLALVVGRDEPEALVVTEPLNGSGCHLVPPGMSCAAERGRCNKATATKRGHWSWPGQVARAGLSI